ncbi:coiled-coil domain-containing glutamate-rich protein 2 [Python bivittatus]|uniref:Secretogranin-1 n=1 Tax=Python bivittatus TaxID=176946 RepID=A0A9F2WBP5_PYTBI|nr:coiled-coil domain-containing glutamate-rich protein 2 [Python bivittatus]
MLSQTASFLLFFLCQALSLPLPTQLSKEDEKVIKCISEILADTLSRPSPIPVTSECMKILREDERVLAMLHHQHLLTELEELTHQENAKHRLDEGSNHNAWEEEQQGEIKKKDEPARQKEAAHEKMEEHAEERKKEEEEEMNKYEKTKNTKEKIKVSQGEDLQETLEEQAEEEQQEEKEIKKRSSSETWSSKENFGHIKKRGPRQPKIRKGMLEEDEEGWNRHEMIKRRLRLGEEENDDTSEEEQKKYHHGGYHDHENWEEEEKRFDMAKRVAEKASDEETAQFEEEEKEKGLKNSNSKAHLHKDWKPWQEEAEEEENHSKMRHGHHHKSVGLDLRKRHWKDEVYLNGRHHDPDEDEEEKEASQSKAQELEKLEEIERELKWAADKLEELKRG